MLTIIIIIYIDINYNNSNGILFLLEIKKNFEYFKIILGTSLIISQVLNL